MKEGSARKLTAEQRAELEALAAMPDEEIDTSDAPEVKDWSRARRGAFYRPIKQQLTLRPDADLVDRFRRIPSAAAIKAVSTRHCASMWSAKNAGRVGRSR